MAAAAEEKNENCNMEEEFDEKGYDSAYTTDCESAFDEDTETFLTDFTDSWDEWEAKYLAAVVEKKKLSAATTEEEEEIKKPVMVTVTIVDEMEVPFEEEEEGVEAEEEKKKKTTTVIEKMILKIPLDYYIDMVLLRGAEVSKSNGEERPNQAGTTSPGV